MSMEYVTKEKEEKQEERRRKGGMKIDDNFTGKGKEFSEIAEEMEQIFQSWLHYSHMTEDEFLKRINQDNFEIQYNNDEEYFVWIDFWILKKSEKVLLKNLIIFWNLRNLLWTLSYC